MQSDDAQQVNTLDKVLASAFDRFGLDWATLSDHLRLSSWDNDGNRLNPQIPMSEAMAKFQVPRIKELQAQGKYADKVIFSSFEWDMPSHDHGNVGILTDNPMSAGALKAASQFEYLFTNRDAALFKPEDVAVWGPKAGTGYNTHAEAMAAIAWLKQNYPSTSYLQINHPSRNPGKYTIAQLREMNDLAPNIVFTLEGMVGNQMEPDRGGYTSDYIEANLPSRTYGGVDYMVLSSEGPGMRCCPKDAASGTWPTPTTTSPCRKANTAAATRRANMPRTTCGATSRTRNRRFTTLRTGKLFAVYGDLINALDFKVKSAKATGEMGSEVAAQSGEDLSITIRFKSPDRNNFEYQLGSGLYANVKPMVDHIDLIAGNVTGRKTPGTSGYDEATSPSTRVLKRFTRADWTLDSEGYYTVTTTVKATGDQYFRLRGTNLGTDVAGETANGEPLPDLKTDDGTDHVARFNKINARNYGDLWFYSNPVFVKTAAQ